MSHSHPNAKHFPSSPDHSASPDFAALAASLQEAAHTLLALSPAGMAKELKEPKAALEAKPPASQSAGETRSFHFPPAAVHMEKELLRKYRAEDFQGLLEEAHTLLVGLVKLMQSVHKDARVKGYVISSLGTQIGHASALVLRMRNVYEKVTPIQK